MWNEDTPTLTTVTHRVRLSTKSNFSPNDRQLCYLNVFLYRHEYSFPVEHVGDGLGCAGVSDIESELRED